MPRPRRAKPEQPPIHRLSCKLTNGQSVDYFFHSDADGLMISELVFDWRGIPTSLTRVPIDTALNQLREHLPHA